MNEASACKEPEVNMRHGNEATGGSGARVILNADDWALNAPTTDRSLDCVLRGVVSSVSAMVFTEDSERAADLAHQFDVDTGLHLNLTMPFSKPSCPSRLIEHQERLSRFLLSRRLAPVLYRPGLAASFDYVVKAQQEEYERLYGAPPHRVDGHHHVHLCANVIFQKLLPDGIIVRRNFSFEPGEKGLLNRSYRRWQDSFLARRYRLADFFFDLTKIESRQRLGHMCELGRRFDVEVETHPIRDEEFSFLVGREFATLAGDVAVARGYLLRSRDRLSNSQKNG
jgi:predicted glycoside hydrolase/deacetylase ChbG (UPF0249 family)